MAEAEDRLDFCKQALGELGTRSTITSLDPPDGSQESYYCNLFFVATRDQVLRAAHWNFAGRSDNLILWKAQPGTPENPDTPLGYTWSIRDPAPRWLYSYKTGFADVIQVRRVRGQDETGFGGVAAEQNHEGVPFEVASDRFDRAGMLVTSTYGVATFTIVSPGTGYKPGDLVFFTTSAVPYGQSASLMVTSVSFAGGVVGVLPIDAGTFMSAPASLNASTTTGAGSGLTGTATFVLNGTDYTKVLLTNARNPVMDYTTADVYVAQYDAGFGDAFMVALEGKLALALLGDRATYGAKMQEANASILNARVRDGNEGLTRYEHVPDWLQVRGVSSMQPPMTWYNPPYGPLFTV